MSNKNSIKPSKSSSSKFNKNKTYSSFWMDDNDYYTSNASRWGGLKGSGNYGSNIVKAIKLNAYRRAISNFVKIVAKRDVPVVFHGATSFTDFNHITLSTDIKDDNFDVTVGLALHEASHLLMTDPKYLPSVIADSSFVYHPNDNQYLFDAWKNLVNWIEDRRIDQFIFSTSPGYKAYYHKMYEHYWNSDIITKALKSSSFRDASDMESWMFRIINSLNPASDFKALPRLQEIMNLIDVKNISRFTHISQVGEIATKIMDIIMESMQAAKNQQSQPQPQDQQNQDQETSPQSDNESSESDDSQEPSDDYKQDDDNTEKQNEGSKQQDEQSDSDSSEQSDDSDDQQQDQSNESTGDIEAPQELTSSQQDQAISAMRKQERFLSGETKKVNADKALTKKLRDIQNSNVELQQVGEGSSSHSCIMWDLSSDSLAMQLMDLHRQAVVAEDDTTKQAINNQIADITRRLPFNLFSDYSSSAGLNTTLFREGEPLNSATAVSKGLELGAILGRKMQVRNESRELVTNRMNTGHIDNKRLAHAGYGIENIFKQITVDSYKKANLHISLDASGSMGGEKWRNTIMMTTALCKAVSMIQNLEVQVSLRITENAGPSLVTIYDSRKNKINHLVATLTLANTNFVTPEGLCFEAQLNKHLLIPGTKELDSYFVNLSDGLPGGCKGYEGASAIKHTKKQVDRMKSELNIKVLGFYIDDSNYVNEDSHAMKNFRTMYGAKESKLVKATDVMAIAKAMNTLFMSK